MEEHPDRLRAADSATCLNPAAPDTLIILPLHDTGVPVEDTQAWARDAQDLGIDVTVHGLPFTSHAYDTQLSDSLAEQARRTITLKYLQTQGLAHP